MPIKKTKTKRTTAKRHSEPNNVIRGAQKKALSRIKAAGFKMVKVPGTGGKFRVVRKKKR